jgi:hypothetical protein
MKPAAIILALMSACACRTNPTGTSGPMRVRLEVFAVGLAAEDDTIQYARRMVDLTRENVNPDAAASAIAGEIAAPAVLHSTSWRWEPDGFIVLTYLAYIENAAFHGNAVRLKWSDIAAPGPTDPLHPRPKEIREQDVLAHGIRHLSFLVRHARDGRLAASLSPRSLAFFRTMCGQLAGRLEAAREFEECAAP